MYITLFHTYCFTIYPPSSSIAPSLSNSIPIYLGIHPSYSPFFLSFFLSFSLISLPIFIYLSIHQFEVPAYLTTYLSNHLPIDLFIFSVYICISSFSNNPFQLDPYLYHFLSSNSLYIKLIHLCPYWNIS